MHTLGSLDFLKKDKTSYILSPYDVGIQFGMIVVMKIAIEFFLFSSIESIMLELWKKMINGDMQMSAYEWLLARWIE